MAYNEFSHVDDHHNDLDWLIYYYKKLVKEYSVLLDKLTQMEDDFNNINPTIDAALERFRQELEALKAQIRDEVNLLMSEIRSDMDALTKEIQEKLGNYLTLIIQLEQTVSDWKRWTKGYVDAKDRELTQKVKGWIEEAQSQVMLWNPCFGKLDNSRHAMDQTYDFLSFGISASRLGRLGVPAADIADMRIPAREWDTKSRLYVMLWWFRKYKPLNMRDPWTGEWVDPRDVIVKIVAEHQGGVKVDEYDASGITVDKLAEANVSAFDYDWSREWFDKLKKEIENGSNGENT